MGDVDRSRSHKVKAIFIIGLNDGVFPSVNKDEGFLNDSDREILKQDGIELAKGTIDRLYEDNFNIYKAFTTAEEKLYLLYSSSDIQGKALRPSMLINKIKKMYPKLKEQSDVVESKSEILNKKTTYEELINNISKLKEQDQIEKIWYYIYDYYKKDTEWNEKLQQSLKGLNYTNIPEKIEQENIDKLYGNTLTEIINKIIDEKLGQSKNYIFTSTAKYRALVARLKKIITKALKYIIETIVQSRFEVLGTELEFGEKGKYKPIRLTL